MSEPGPYRPQHDAHVQAKYAAESKAEGDRKMKRAWRILEAAKSSAESGMAVDARMKAMGAKVGHIGRRESSWLEEINIVRGYAEPGYGDDDSIIAFGNWNDIDGTWNEAERRYTKLSKMPSRVAKLLEKAGVEVEWSDEWSMCDECNRAVRTSANSYGWKRSYTMPDDGGILCEDCTLENPESYLESLEGNPNTASTLSIDPGAHGYKRLEIDFENGFHAGQDDDPKAVAKALRKRGVTRFLFAIDDVGQFDMKFSVWVHEDDMPERGLVAEIDPAECRGPSPSEGLKRALQDVSRAEAKVPPGDGPIIVKCDISKGTAEAKRVSPQDFVDGKALE